MLHVNLCTHTHTHTYTPQARFFSVFFIRALYHSTLLMLTAQLGEADKTGSGYRGLESY